MDIDELIRGWRINYGMDTRTPMEAAQWWRDYARGRDLCAPTGTILALGAAIEEIERLSAELKKIIETSPFNGGHMQQIARKALGEEK